MSTILTLLDPQQARQYYADGIWQPHTMYAMLRRHAAARPDAFALRDSVHRLTWAQALDWV
ncbi:MAG: cyclohexanecarboxylate-CoA ligase, partial [Burkholderiaceae bacterium]